MRKRLFLGLRILLGLLVGLFLITLVASTPKVQNYLAQRFISQLTTQYGIDLSVDAVRVNPLAFNATLQHLLIPDHKGDTLIYIRSLSSRFRSLKALYASASQSQYRLGETLVNIKTHSGDSLSNLQMYLNELPKGSGNAFGAERIRTGALKVRYIDDSIGEAHTLDFKKIDIQNLRLGSKQVSGEFELAGHYEKNNLLVEPDFSLEGKFETHEGVALGSLITVRAKDEAIELDSLTYDFNSGRWKFKVEDAFMTGQRLKALGLSVTNVPSVYWSGVLTLHGGKLEAQNLALQWGESTAVLDASLNFNVPGNSYRLNFTDIAAYWKDIKGYRSILKTEGVQRLNMASTVPWRGALDLENNSQVFSLKGYFDISEAHLSISYERNKKVEVLRGGLSKVPIEWFLPGTKQLLTTSFEAQRMTSQPFVIDGSLESLSWPGNKQLKAVDYSIVLNPNQYDIALKSAVKGQNFTTNFTLERLNNSWSIVGSADFRRFDVLLSDTPSTAAVLSTGADFSVWGSSWVDIQGSISLDGLRFYTSSQEVIEVGSVQMSLTVDQEKDHLFKVVSEDFVNLLVSGNYHLFDWQTALSELRLPDNFELDADIQTGTRWIDLIEGSTVLPEITGYLRYSKGLFKSDIRLSRFRYDAFDLKELHGFTDGAGNFVIEAESLNSPFFDLSSIRTDIGASSLSLMASTAGETPDQFAFNFSWNRPSDDHIKLYIEPSSFTLKQYEWGIDKSSEIDLDIVHKSVTFNRLDLRTVDDGYLALQGGYQDNENYTFSLELENAPLETITPEIKNLEIKGGATGSLQFKRQNGRYDPRFNLSIEDLVVNSKFVGFFNGVVNGSSNADVFTLQADILNTGTPTLELSGILNQTDNGQFTLDADARFSQFDISPFSALGTTTFSDLRGLASGVVSLTNTLDSPELLGELVLDSSGLRFPYLGVDFDVVDRPTIRLNRNSFYFDHFRLKDTSFQTEIEIDGFIQHSGLKNFEFDLGVATLSESSLVLKTEASEDALYYGTGFVSGTGSIKGTPSSTVVQVDAVTKKGSSLIIPLNSDTVDFSDDLVRFVNSEPIAEVQRSFTPIETQKGISLDFNLVVTPEAMVEVIVDRESGSKLRGNGAGLFRLQVAPGDEFNIFGEYALASGTYDYRFGGLIDKGFSLAPGGNLIWNGDPYDADINLEAVYSLSANPAPLLDSSSFPRPVQTDVVIQLGGKLLNPTIDFSLRFPTLNSVVRSEIEYRLQDRSTLERNVFFLLAQGNFVNEQMGLSQQALTGNLLQSASGLLEEVLGASEVLDLGLSYEQGYRNPNANVAIEDRIGVTLSTQLGNRLMFNGKLGVPVGRVTETVVAGDVELQLILNEEGTLSAKIFNRENTLSQFLASIPGYTQGIGLSYQVDFDNFKDLIRRVLKSTNTTEE